MTETATVPKKSSYTSYHKSSYEKNKLLICAKAKAKRALIKAAKALKLAEKEKQKIN